MKQVLLKNDEVTIILEDGIVIATWESQAVDLTVAQRAVKYRLEATKHQSYPLLSNIKPIKNISKPARDYLASEDGCEGIIAAAVLIDSPLGSMIGNFFISISRPLRPTKIFTDETEAKKWLAKFVSKESI